MSVLAAADETSYLDIHIDVLNAAKSSASDGQVVHDLPCESPLLAADWFKGKKIAHRWDGEHGGWFVAKVTSLVKTGDDKGSWKVRYYSTPQYGASTNTHTLKRGDCGVNKLWVLLS